MKSIIPEILLQNTSYKIITGF